MRLLRCLGPWLLLCAPAAAQSATFVRSVLPQEGDNVDMQVADMDGDGLLDLFVAVRLEDGRREILVYRLRPDGAYPATPDQRIEVKREVVCWGFGEFRPDDPGVELLFTTRSAAYTFSPRSASYRDNIREVVKADLLLDLADERELLEWMQIADVDGDGTDEIVLATVHGYLLVQVDGTILGEVALPLGQERRPAAARVFQVGAEATLSSQPLADLVVPDEDPGVLDPPPMLFAEEWLPLPYLMDADGDGLADLIYYAPDSGEVRVHRMGHDQDGRLRLADAPGPVLSVHEGEWRLAELEPVHVGGGPALDLLLVRSEDATGLTIDWQFMVFLDPFAGGGGLGRPAGRITVDATVAGAHLVDLDGDGSKDLGVSAWSLKLQALGLEGVDIEHVVSVYRQTERGYAERAELRYARSYDANSFTAFSLVPPLPGDLDGDGATDLLEPDADGTLEIRPLRRRDGSARFSDTPWRTFQALALTSIVSVRDLNGDGVADLRIAHGLRREVEMLVSRRQ
ncbi:MAG: VCBS repeat-containing protein [Planctomycetota bacterium]|nr:MAG: VCBS repeat-containing protein [Planctomycetota bacterium]